MTDQVNTVPTVPAPECTQCGRETRLVGIESHPRLALTEVNTYACDRCDKSEIVVVPLTKEKPLPPDEESVASAL